VSRVDLQELARREGGRVGIRGQGGEDIPCPALQREGPENYGLDVLHRSSEWLDSQCGPSFSSRVRVAARSRRVCGLGFRSLSLASTVAAWEMVEALLKFRLLPFLINGSPASGHASCSISGEVGQEGLLHFPHTLSPTTPPTSELLVAQVQKGGDLSRIVAIMDESNDNFGTVPVIDADEVGGLRGMLGQDLGQLLDGWMAAYDAWEIKSYPAKGKLKACR